jgi:hypothetical protein
VDIAAFAISLVAMLIAGGALYYTRRADQRARRQERREEAAITSELVVGGAIPSDWQGRRAYRFHITNKGRTHASDVDAYLVDQNDHEVSEFSYEHSRLPGLPPGERDEVAVVVKDEHRERNPLRLKVKWFGSSGPDEYTSKAPIPAE